MIWSRLVTKWNKIKFCTQIKCLAHLKLPLIECLCNVCSGFFFSIHSFTLFFCVYYFFYLCLIRLGCFVCSLLKRHHEKKNIRTFTTFIELVFFFFYFLFSLLIPLLPNVWKKWHLFCLFTSFFATIPLFIWRMNECIQVKQA